ncbi:glycosyltransferase [Methylobacterium gregans]|uniref:4'-demethylrebeccamycin synthase n=1 Tax=Methylobacterium gregans TaxID=374424 RepID=A0AA37HPJ5_9HYPH|nr:glycosyltransferase [Methylobacterium gregans]MDQ0519512.1 MGT family glycosyltransferase [Methylobacterium gregans]GJD79286.1 4'-demethylrebeccamycin synthase [Methylobacterium gregans]GLS52847.1 glycosyl transferase [Methylobacterium gregans]
MKILIAATPLTGHVNPLMAIGRLLASRGDDVVVTTDPLFAEKVERAGLRFAPCDDFGSASYLEPDLPPGPERWTHEFERRFIAPMPAQAARLRALIAQEAPDVIVAGSLFLGVLPLLLDRRPRPPIAVVNVSFLFLDRPDGAPIGLGLPPAHDAAERARYALLKARMDAAFVNPVRAHADRRLAELGLPPLPASLTQSIVVLPEIFLQPGVPDFEYDFGSLPKTLRFVGLLPSGQTAVQLPEWWLTRDRTKRVVLVTQGTLANADFGELVEPTLAALADRDDLLLVATTGGRPLSSLKAPLPANARVGTFLPFETILPEIDLLVTNGGYGSVSQALAAGVPIVVAGLTEDKAEVAARIGWSGVGINLATNAPSVAALREGIDRALSDPGFAQRAEAMADAFAARNAAQTILTQVNALAA